MDWPFLRPPERVPEIPVVCREHLQQLEKIQEVLPSRRGSFTPLLQLKKFPDIPVSTREEARESRPHPEEPRFHLLAREKYPKIHVSTGEESSGSGTGSTLDLRPRHRRERNPERPPSNSHGDWPFLTPPQRVPEDPVKYPKIHVSTGEESSGSGTGSTLDLRPRHRRERNPERPPSNSHGDWPFLTPPQRVPEDPVKYPKIHVSTGEESSGSGTGSTLDLRPRHRRERNPERPPSNSHGDWPFLTPPQRVPEDPVKYPKIHVSTGEESSGSGTHSTQDLRPRHRRERNPERPPSNSHGDWPFLRPTERVPEVPVKYPKIHVSTEEESSGSATHSTQDLRPRHRRERNPERPSCNSHGDWPFLRPPERVPEVPVLSREHLLQLEKIQEVLHSRRDEAHFR
ncbi:hypothetical protein AB1E19_018844 [Capra hircus]